MKKELDTNTIMNELRGGSSFFQRSKPEAETTVSTPAQEKQELSSSLPLSQVHNRSVPTSSDLTSKQETQLTTKHVSNEERKQESLQPSNQDSIEDRILDALASTPIKPNTFRYSLEELNFIRDAVYDAEVIHQTKLDKNDIMRIALEWLMFDYQEKGEASLLVSLLTRKKARK